MRSRTRVAALASIVIALGVATPADAGSPNSKPTQVVLVGSGYSGTSEGGVSNAYGRLDTAKRCRANRTVRLFAFIGETKKLIDVDRSSRNGSWAGEGRVASNPDGYQAVAERAKRGKVVCRGGSVAT